MADTYVLVHGAWHTGHELEAVARHIRDAGHHVHCPTLAGNHKNDSRAGTGLDDAIASLAHYLDTHDLKEVRLVGHGYGGMVISGVADRSLQRLKRLVYVNAFVPNNGDSLNDLVPPIYVGMFNAIAAANDGAVMLPFEIWREAFRSRRRRSCAGKIGLRRAQSSPLQDLHRQDRPEQAAGRNADRQVLCQLPAGHRPAAQLSPGIRVCRSVSGCFA